jgi:hypothetical protein
MIYPSNERILESVLRAFDEVLIPTLRRHLSESAGEKIAEEKRALSNAYTMSHLVRLTRNRVASQGQHYYDEMALLEPLLRAAAALAGNAGDRSNSQLVEELEGAANSSWLPPGRYPSLAITAERANTLRLAVDKALAWLQSNADSLATDSRYVALRARIREYIGKQLADEATIVDAAFRGFGLRR